MLKSFVKFGLIMMVTMVVTYFLAGLVARFALGGSDFYSPSRTAISYLRDPTAPGMALTVWPAQALRGLLLAAALFVVRKQLLAMGNLRGGLALAAIIFVVGYVAASGGMIEHFVWSNEYPLRFAAFTFIEVILQVAIMGPWTVVWMRRVGVE